MSEGQQRSWLAEILKCNATDVALQLIAGDASPRKFYRVSGPASCSRVLMVSPPTENNERFVLIQRTLEGAGVRVPAMPRANLALGYFLLEDLGCLLYTSPSPRDVEESRMPASA